MFNTKGYTKQQWDREIGWGARPPEHEPCVETVSAPKKEGQDTSSVSQATSPQLEPYSDFDLERLGCSGGWLERQP